jgi:hypothetical protein
MGLSIDVTSRTSNCYAARCFVVMLARLLSHTQEACDCMMFIRAAYLHFHDRDKSTEISVGKNVKTSISTMATLTVKSKETIQHLLQECYAEIDSLKAHQSIRRHKQARREFEADRGFSHKYASNVCR